MVKFEGKLISGPVIVALSGLLFPVMGTAAREVRPAAAEAQAAPQPSPLGAYLAARHAQQERSYGAAARYMGAALQADPDNDDLVRRTFMFRISDGDIAKAIPLATRIADLDRRSGFADLVLVLQKLKAGAYQEALARTRMLPDDGVDRLEAPLMTAWAQAGMGKGGEALQTLAEAKAPSRLPQLILFQRALIADKTDHVDEAAQLYDQLTSGATPLTWRTVELAGNFYERHQRDAAARRLFQRFKTDPDSGAVVDAAMKRLDSGTMPKRLIVTAQDGAAEALFDIASILNARETMDIALIHARLALYLKPNFPIAQLLVAEIADELGHSEEALADYRAVDRASPLYWSARSRQAAMLDQLARSDEAVALLRAMAAERPHDYQAMVELGDVLRTHDRFKEAVAAYDDAFARYGTGQPADWRLYYSRGIALERSQQWPRAESDFRRALELEPQQPMVLNYLGYTWIDQGVHLDRALGMVERAVALSPNDGYIVDSLGWAYFRLGNYDKATENLERAIELVPEDPTINDHLGDAYWRTGRHLEARFQWNRALSFKPEAGEATKIESKLEHGLGQPVTAVQSKGG